jgi:hypothetical protein
MERTLRKGVQRRRAARIATAAFRIFDIQIVSSPPRLTDPLSAFRAEPINSFSKYWNQRHNYFDTLGHGYKE